MVQRQSPEDQYQQYELALVNNASYINVIAKKLLILKHKRFTHIFSPAAQKIYTDYRAE